MAELVEIKGLKALEKRLMEIPAELTDKKKVVQKAAKAGAIVYKKGAQRRAPQKRGILKRDIRIKLLPKKHSRYAGHYAVGILRRKGKGRARHGHLVEFGTKPHVIKPRKGKALVLGGKRGWVSAGRGGGSVFNDSSVVAVVKHPGTRAQPFLRPTFEQDTPQAIKAVKIEMAKGIKALGKK